MSNLSEAEIIPHVPKNIQNLYCVNVISSDKIKTNTFVSEKAFNGTFEIEVKINRFQTGFQLECTTFVD